MTTLAQVITLRQAALDAAAKQRQVKDDLWSAHYGDLSPDDDGEHPERDAAYQAQVAVTDLAGLSAARQSAEQAMVEAYLNATDHPRLIAAQLPTLRENVALDGAIWSKLKNLILNSSPRALRGGR